MARRIYDTRAYRDARKRMRGLSCSLCGAPPPSTVDHIVPVVYGGTNEPSNLRPLCTPCNSSLGARVGNARRRRRGVSRRSVW